MSEHETGLLELLEQVAREKGEDFDFSRRISGPARQLARNLLRLRTTRGLTQTDLASRAKMDQPRIAELESGAGNPTLRTIARLADALGVSASGLLSTADATRIGQTAPAPKILERASQVEVVEVVDLSAFGASTQEVDAVETQRRGTDSELELAS
jgi:transcriptional regulator with XRE-family HTH domain